MSVSIGLNVKLFSVTHCLQTHHMTYDYYSTTHLLSQDVRTARWRKSENFLLDF